MEKFKSKLTLLSRFIRKNPYFFLILSLFILIGSFIRFYNLGNIGHHYDLVTTQYAWGRNAFMMGFRDFWASYIYVLDYFPTAIYINMVAFTFSIPFGGDPQSFVSVMKVFNWISDIFFLSILFYLGRYYAKWEIKKTLILTCLGYIVPSIWFVGGVWGQIDTFMISLGLTSLILAYIAAKNKKSKHYFIFSGLIFGFAFAIKPTAFLLLPFILISIIKPFTNFKEISKNFVFWIIPMFMISIFLNMPALLANPIRLILILLEPINRTDQLVVGASTFWHMIGINGISSEIKLIDFLGLKITAKEFGFYLWFILIGFFLLLHVYNGRKYSMEKLSESFKTYLCKRFKLIDLMYFAFISSTIYFMFFSKMMSRYLHTSILLSLCILMLYRGKNFWALFTFVMLMNIGYFFNNIFMLIEKQNVPWTIDFMNLFDTNLMSVGAVMNFISMLGIFLIIILEWIKPQSSIIKLKRRNNYS